MFLADARLDLSGEPSVGFWVPFQPRKPVRTRHELQMSYAQQRVSHPLLHNFWALPAQLHIRTTPPVVLGGYANRVLFDAPQIPAEIQSFQWILVEWDENLEKLKKISQE